MARAGRAAVAIILFAIAGRAGAQDCGLPGPAAAAPVSSASVACPARFVGTWALLGKTIGAGPLAKKDLKTTVRLEIRETPTGLEVRRSWTVLLPNG